MKRLLLLLFLSPVILLAQTRRKNVIDSAKDAAAINLQHMSASMQNNPCTKVAELRTIDNGEYITTVVFHHIITAADSAVRETETITELHPLSVVKFHTEDIPVSKPGIVTLPPPPVFRAVTITALPPLPVFKFDTEHIPVSKAEIAMTLPPVHFSQAEKITALPLVTLNTADIPVFKAELVTEPPRIYFIQADSITGLQPLPVVQLHTKDIPVIKTEILTLPPPLVFRVDIISDLSPFPLVKLNMEVIPVRKREIVVTFPDIWEIRTPVAEMHLSEDGYSLLQKLEGYSPELYSLNDGGFTIGFGFFVPYKEGAKWGKGITLDEAERILQQKVPAYEAQVKEYVNVPLTQREFDALTLLAYNLGGFSKATSIINDINNMVDFDQLQSDWKRFVHSKAPNVSKGLMNRRKDELEVRKTSNYQPDRKIQILKVRK